MPGICLQKKILAGPIFKRAPNETEIALAIEKEIPAIFDYLSSSLQGDYLMGASLTLADLAVGGLFMAMHHCDVQCDGERWPALADYIARLMALPAFSKVVQEERMMLKMLGA